MSTRIIYTSRTGNTKMLAQRIFETVEDDDKNIYPVEEWQHDTDADTYFVGFWNNRGTCSLEICDLLDELDGRRVALFGTCGMPDSHDYYQTVEDAVKVWLPDHVDYLGCFLCQGKMPMAVRRRYEEKKEELKERENSPDGKMSVEEAARREKELERLIENFDNALLHPDDEDLKNAADFAEKCLEKQEA